MAARVAVIGAGLAGLTAARTLADAGVAPTVFEKSRGLGGRLATRRGSDGFYFDHGAPSVAGSRTAFAAFLDAARAAGHAADWDGETVGVPGMSGLVQGLAAGLDIRFSAEVAAVAPAGGRWRVAAAGREDSFEAVVVTAPAPQTARLCAAVAAVAGPASAARMTPVWALMAALPGAGEGSARIEGAGGALERATRSSSKPGRATAPERWVAHAAADWSAARLEDAPDSVAGALLAALVGALGRDPAAALHARAHRWRFARAAAPVGAPCLVADGLIAAGDWLLGPQAEDAHASGLSAAQAALARLV